MGDEIRAAALSALKARFTADDLEHRAKIEAEAYRLVHIAHQRLKSETLARVNEKYARQEQVAGRPYLAIEEGEETEEHRRRAGHGAAATAPTRKAAIDNLLDGVTIHRGADWTRPGGLLGDMVDWILATSPNPNRPLAVAAAVATLAPVAGWARLFGPTGSSLNPYIIMLGPTGIGKGRPFKAVGQILGAAGYAKLHRWGGAFSVSGLEAIIVKSPAVVMAKDEIAKSLLPRMTGSKATANEMAMQDFLLQLWARDARDIAFETTERSPKSEVQSAVIESPQFTLFGADIPERFYGALQSGNVDDGFMNRMLIAEAAPDETNDDPPDIGVPPNIIKALNVILRDGREGNLAGTRLRADRRVSWASDAVKHAWIDLRNKLRAVALSNLPGTPLFVRTAEYAVRLATLHALSRGADARVTDEDLAWGAEWAIVSARKMLDGAANMMARNDHERMVNDVKKIIRRGDVISQSVLLRRVLLALLLLYRYEKSEKIVPLHCLPTISAPNAYIHKETMLIAGLSDPSPVVSLAAWPSYRESRSRGVTS